MKGTKLTSILCKSAMCAKKDNYMLKNTRLDTSRTSDGR